MSASFGFHYPDSTDSSRCTIVLPRSKEEVQANAAQLGMDDPDHPLHALFWPDDSPPSSPSPEMEQYRQWTAHVTRCKAIELFESMNEGPASQPAKSHDGALIFDGEWYSSTDSDSEASAEDVKVDVSAAFSPENCPPTFQIPGLASAAPIRPAPGEDTRELIRTFDPAVPHVAFAHLTGPSAFGQLLLAALGTNPLMLNAYGMVKTVRTVNHETGECKIQFRVEPTYVKTCLDGLGNITDTLLCAVHDFRPVEHPNGTADMPSTLTQEARDFFGGTPALLLVRSCPQRHAAEVIFDTFQEAVEWMWDFRQVYIYYLHFLVHHMIRGLSTQCRLNFAAIINGCRRDYLEGVNPAAFRGCSESLIQLMGNKAVKQAMAFKCASLLRETPVLRILESTVGDECILTMCPIEELDTVAHPDAAQRRIARHLVEIWEGLEDSDRIVHLSPWWH